MSYVNKISGNSIGDEVVREKIDDPNEGLRRDIYHLANAVEVILRSIQASEEARNVGNYYTTQDAFFTITGWEESSTTPEYNETLARSVMEISHISSHAADDYFTDKDGRNIL